MDDTAVFREHIPETIIPGRRLGRHVHRDPAHIAANPPQLADALISVRHTSAGLPLDQGELGSCTANALCGALNSIPHWTPGAATLNETDAVTVYERETSDEGQPYPPNDPGGTGLNVCKVAKQHGWIT